MPNCRTGQSPEFIELLKERKAAIDAPCVFPFTLAVNNKTYHSCTYDFMHITGYQPWCATNEPAPNKKRSVKGDAFENINWGLCLDESSCPIPPRRKPNG